MMRDLTKYLNLDRRLQPLSLAIGCADKMFQNPRPLGSVQVSLKNVHKPIIQNPSGYYLFLSLDNGPHELTILSDYYLDKKFVLNLPDDDLTPEEEKILDFDEIHLINLAKMEAPENPEKRGPLLAELSLMPDVNYPFSAGSTLVRGEIVASDTKNPIADSWIEIESMDISSPPAVLQFHANEKGQFVLCCNQVKRKKADQPLVIMQINGKDFGGGEDIKITAKSEYFKAQELPITILDGQTKTLQTIELKR